MTSPSAMREGFVSYRLLLVVVAMIVALVPRTADAARMPHHDLTSLAYEAEFIVRARPIAEHKKDEYRTIRTVRVTHSYKGDLAVGATFDIDDSLYNLTPTHGSAGAPKPTLGDEIILFLKVRTSPFGPVDVDEPRSHAPAGDAGANDFYILSNGLRIFLDGKAYRFEQWNNPGGFEPVAQGHDPFDLFGDPRGGSGLDLPGFEAELARALERANVVRATLAEPDSPARRARLVALCGPASADEAPAGTAFRGFYMNLVARRIIEALAKTKDLASTLDALSRSTGVNTFMLDAPFEVSALLDAAADERAPVPRRIAALRMLEGRKLDLWESPTADARIVALFGDREPEIRIRALDIQPTKTPSNRMKKAILDRWKVETNERVRVALVHAAVARQMRSALIKTPAEPPAIAVDRHRDVLTMSWADAADNVDFMIRSAVVVARRPGEPERKIDFLANPVSYTNGSTGYVTMRIAFEPPMTPGPAEIELSFVLGELTKRRPAVIRTISLGSMNVTPDMILGSETADAGAAPSVTPMPIPPAVTSSASTSAPINTVPKRSACGCEVVGARTSPGGIPFLTLPFLARIVQKRRHRTRPDHTAQLRCADLNVQPRSAHHALHEAENCGFTEA